MAEKADRGLAGATEGTVNSFHQKKKQKSSPSPHPLARRGTGIAHKAQGVWCTPNRAPCCLGAQGSWTPLSPTAKQSSPVKLRGSSGSVAWVSKDLRQVPPTPPPSLPPDSLRARGVLIHRACLDAHGDRHDPIQLFLQRLARRWAGRRSVPTALTDGGAPRRPCALLQGQP